MNSAGGVEKLKVGISGAHGKLGTPILAAIESAEDLVVHAIKGRDQHPEVLDGSDVILDVSVAQGARETLAWAAEAGIDVVCGTTGFTASEVDGFNTAFARNGARCFVVPNFAIGVALLVRFAETAAAYFGDVEIIELHHQQKLDAPSGTARMTASRIGQVLGDAKQADSPQGAARGELIDGVRVHSMRLPGLVAHEEVIFGGSGQTLSIRHDSMSRESFVDGALLCLRKVKTLPAGLTTGLDAVLD